MARYLIFAAAICAGFAVGITAAAAGGFIVVFVNLLNFPAFITIVVLPFLLTVILFGFKETCLAFSMPFRKEADKGQLLKASRLIRTHGKIIWIVGVIAALIVAVTVLWFLEDKSGLGPNLAFVLITLLYGAVLTLMVIIPFTVFINKRLDE